MMGEKIKKFKNRLSKIWYFVTTEVWEEEEEKHGRVKRGGIRILKTILVAIQGFTSGRLQTSASALTYYSTLSIVPIMALLLSIAQGLGMRSFLESKFVSEIPGQAEIFQQLIGFSERSLSITSSGSETIMGIGIGLFIWAIYNLFSQIENLFNQIWQVKKGRSFMRRFTDYMSLMFIMPIFIIITSGISVYAQTELKSILSTYDFAGQIINPMIVFAVNLAPFILSWVIFTLSFIYMPTTKVKFIPGLIAGFFAGTAFQVFQGVYISGQIWITRYGAIYGSFAALPLFMLWMQASWTIVLIGAELSYAIQNVSAFDFERHISKVSFNFQRRFALLITSNVVKAFATGKPALTVKQIAEKEQIPIRLVNEMAQSLVEAGLFTEVVTEGESPAYQPAMDISKLTLAVVCEHYEAKGLDKFHLVRSDNYKHLESHLEGLKIDMQNSSSNILIKDL